VADTSKRRGANQVIGTLLNTYSRSKTCSVHLESQSVPEEIILFFYLLTLISCVVVKVAGSV